MCVRGIPVPLWSLLEEEEGTERGKETEAHNTQLCELSHCSLYPDRVYIHTDRAGATGTATTAMAVPLFDHGLRKIECH